MLEILSNGNKSTNEKPWLTIVEPDTIENLIQVLSTHPLDPTFEDYGNFYNPNPTWIKPEADKIYKGCSKFFGNFSSISHVFNIITDEPEVIQTLTEAINKNINTKEYKKLRKEYIEVKQRKENARKLFERKEITQRQMYDMMAGII